MKRKQLIPAVAIAVVLLLVMFIIGQIKIENLFVFSDDGYAVSGDVSGTLKNGSSDTVALQEVSADDTVIRSGSSCYVGDDQNDIDVNYPAYLYGGAVLQPVTDEMDLVDQDFDTEDMLAGMYVSNGITFLPDLTQADEEEFIFLKLKNGLYYNVMPMTVTRDSITTEIPMNCILDAEDSVIRYYSYENGTLVYNALNTLDATVSIGEVDITYDELLTRLKKIQEASDSGKTASDEEQATATPQTGSDVPVSTAEADGSASGEDGDDGEDTAKATKAPKEKKSGSSGGGSAVRPPRVSGGGSSSGGGSDSGSGSGDVEITPDPDNPETMVGIPVVTLSDFSTGVYTVTAKAVISDPGENFYKASVEVYWDKNGDGTISSENECGSRKTVKKDGTVTVTSVPPDTNIVLRVKVYYYKNGKKLNYYCYDEFKLGPQGQGLKTKSMDTLAPVYVNAETTAEGSVYSQSTISLYAFELSGTSDVLGNVNKVRVTLTSKTDADDTYDFTISRTRSKAYMNAAGTWTSDNTVYGLTSNTEYDYVITVLDLFGNSLKTASGVYKGSPAYTEGGNYSSIKTQEISGTSRTCKKTPTAKAKVVNQGVGSQKITIEVTDEDGAVAAAMADGKGGTGLKFYILDPSDTSGGSDGTVVPLFLSSYSSGDDVISLTDGSGQTLFYNEISFTALSSSWTLGKNNLETAKAYRLIVTADYDADDTDDTDNNLRSGVVIADSNFLTTSLSSLGKTAYNFKSFSLGENTAVLGVQLNKNRTNADLMQYFVSKIKIGISPRSGSSKLYDITLQRDALQNADCVLYDEDAGMYYLDTACYTLTQADGTVPNPVTVYLYGYNPQSDNYSTAWGFITYAQSPGVLQISLNADSVSSNTAYTLTVDTTGETISVSSLADRLTKEYDLNNSNASYRKCNFSTIKHMPHASYEDLVVLGSDMYLYGLSFDDRDVAITGNGSNPVHSVTVKVTYPAAANLTVFSTSYDLTYAKNESGEYYAYLPDAIHVQNLVSGAEYQITVTADYLKTGDSVKTNVSLMNENEEWKFTAGEGISGKINLTELTRGTSDFTAKLNLTAQDALNNLKQDRKLYFTVEKCGLEEDFDENSDVTQICLQQVGLTQDEMLFTPVTAGDTEGAYSYNRAMTLSLDLDSRYRMTISVRYYNRVTEQYEDVRLDRVEFTTDETTYIISCESDLSKLKTSLSAKFLVISDLNLACSATGAQYLKNYTSITFNGKIDFAGHTLTLDYDRQANNVPIISTLTSAGVIENLVLHFRLDGTYAMTGQILCNFIRANYGTIRNIVVINDYAKGRIAHYKCAPIMDNMGTIENFCVYYSTDSTNYGYYQMDGLVETNMGGIIRNGYVYSAVNLTSGSGVYTGSSGSRRYTSGLVGWNSSGGIIENVYAYLTLVTENGSELNKTGLLCGYNNAIIRNCFAIGDRYNYKFVKGVQQAAEIYPSVPTIIGSSGSSAVAENVGYFSVNTYSGSYRHITDYNLLKEADWYSTALGSTANWIVDDQLSLGYLPKIDMPDVISSKQINVQIPSGTTAVRPTYRKCAFTLSEDGQSGSLKLYFANRNSVEISDIVIDGLTIVINSQYADEESGLWVVDTTVTPWDYRDAYTLTEYSYTGASSPVTVSETVDCSFGFVITNENWGTVDLDANGYYILGENIDLANDTVKSKWFRYGVSTSAIEAGMGLTDFTFSGVLDGNGYTLSGVSVSDSFIYGLKGGTVKNLTVDGFTVSGTAANGTLAAYQGFVGSLSSNATLTDLYVKNASLLNGGGYTGTLAGYTTNSAIQNCGVAGADIAAGSGAANVCQGGLVGKDKNTLVSNCYVYELSSVNRKGTSQTGIGGLVGYMSGLTKITCCYAQGEIETSYSVAGGIAGRTESEISSCWSNVSVSSDNTYVGGLAGYVSFDLADFQAQAAYGWGGITNYPIKNNLVCGELYAGGQTTITNRFYGGSQVGTITYSVSNNYAYASQLLNGSTSTAVNGATKLLTGTDLKNANTLRLTVKLGTDFRYTEYGDYSGVSTGSLPILYSDDGSAVLPYQKNQSLTKAAMAITASGAGTYKEDGSYEGLTVTVYAGIEGLTADDAQTLADGMTLSADNNALTLQLAGDVIADGTMSVPSGDTKITVTRFKMTFDVTKIGKYMDSYRLTLQYGGSKASAKVQFTIQNEITGTNSAENLYLSIRNAADWNSLMSEYGSSTQNFRVIGDVDFTETGSYAVMQVTVNRLEGMKSKADGTGIESAVISGLTYDGAKGNALVKESVTQLSAVTFRGITVTNTDGSGGTGLGVILTNTGTITDVLFDTVTITSRSYKNVGCVASSTGPILNTTAQDINITAAGGSNIGCIVGSTSNYLDGCTVKSAAKAAALESYTGSDALTRDNSSCGIDAGTATYVGGMVGYTTSYLLTCKAYGVRLSGTGSYYGGLTGYRYYNASPSMNDTMRCWVQKCSIYSKNYAAGSTSYTYSPISYHSVENCYVRTTGSYAGGLLSTQDHTSVNYNTVKNCTIIADGSYAYGLTQTGSISYCVVEGCSITAAGSYAGGISGTAVVTRTGVLVKDCTISAKNYAGGAVGYYIGGENTPGSFTSCIIYNCTVTASADYAGGFAGYNANSSYTGDIVYNVTVSANRYAGGLIGSSQGCHIQYCEIMASVKATGTYAGGVIGYAVGYRYLTVDNNRDLQIKYCLVQTEVNSNGYAAGLIGAFEPGTQAVKSDGTSVTEAEGYYSYLKGSNIYANVFSGTIRGGTWAWYALTSSGRNISSYNYDKPGGSSYDNTSGDKGVSRMRFLNTAAAGDTGTTSSILASSTYPSAWTNTKNGYTDTLTVTRADLMQTTAYRYNSDLGWSSGNGGYDLSTATTGTGIFPLLKKTGSSGLLSNLFTAGQAGNAKGSMTSVETPSSADLNGLKITIPTGSGASAASFTGLTQNSLEPDIYASGADLLQVEFPGWTQELQQQAEELEYYPVITLSDTNGTQLLSTELKGRAVAFPYDYQTDLVLTVTCDIGKLETVIRAAEVKRRVMVYGSQGYLLSNGVLQDLDGKVLTASGWSDDGTAAVTIVNISGGKAIAADGTVYSVTDGTACGTAREMTAFCDAEPIVSYADGSSLIHSYHSYTVTETDGVQSVSEGMLVAKNGSSKVLSTQMNTQARDILYDTYLDTEYLMFVEYDSLVRYQFTEKGVELPKDMSINNVMQLTEAYDSTRPIAIVLYRNGTAVAFNYTTGEQLGSWQLEDLTEELSFTEILFQNFADLVSIWTGKGGIVNAGEAGEVIGLLEGDTNVDGAYRELVGDAEGGTYRGAAGGQAEQTNGSADGTEDAASADNAYAPGSGGTADGGTALPEGGTAAGAGTGDADGLTGAGAGTEGVTGSGTAGGDMDKTADAEGEGETAGAAGPADGSAAHKVSLPAYTTVVSDEGGTAVYATEEYLGENSGSAVSEEEKIRALESAGVLSASITTQTEQKHEQNGIVYLAAISGAIAFGIAGLLVTVGRKSRKKQ